MSARISGLEELAAKFQLLGAELTVSAEVALSAGAIPITNAWKRNAPVKTGTYRRSIHQLSTERDGDGVTVLVGTDIVDPPYPYYLEYGTRHMAPRPSARPAFDEHAGEAMAEIAAVLGAQIKRVTS